eukprot:TRINITY_DN5506_c0_g1_i3.p1 TRINITY_DN5506_c0_g1~~TRINITY_DN5506_c0_g1_i3.p1  ORF type:complete len:105 (-),score=8.80 TRINITY_DN5506_c0_g1_i3:394-708(-)
MGALLSIKLLSKYQNSFDFTILSAPPLAVPDNISPALITVGKAVSSISPKLGLVCLIPFGISRDNHIVSQTIFTPTDTCYSLFPSLLSHSCNLFFFRSIWTFRP